MRHSRNRLSYKYRRTIQHMPLTLQAQQSLVNEFADEIQLQVSLVRLIGDYYRVGADLFRQIGRAGVFLAGRDQDCARFRF